MEFHHAEEDQRALVLDMLRTFEMQTKNAVRDALGTRSFDAMLRLRFPKATSAEIEYMLGFVESNKQELVLAASRAKYKSLKPDVRSLFERFDVDASGAIDEKEFITCMMACGLRGYDLDKPQLITHFRKYATLSEDGVHEGEAVLNVSQFETLLHSCGLMQHVKTLLTRSKSIQSTTTRSLSTGARRKLSQVLLEPEDAGHDLAEGELHNFFRGCARLRPSLANKGFNVLHLFG